MAFASAYDQRLLSGEPEIRSSSSVKPTFVFLPYISLVEATKMRAWWRWALMTTFSVPCRLIRRLSSGLSRIVKVPDCRR